MPVGSATRIARSLCASALIALLTLAAGCDDDGDGGVRSKADITISGPHQVEVGKTISLSAAPAATAEQKDTSYTWKSDDSAIATVDAQGTVTGVTAGETRIQVTGQQTNATAEHVIVVLAKSGSGGSAAVLVKADGNRATVLVNATLQLSAETINGTDSSYEWSIATEQSDIASVSADGVVTGLAPGSVTVSARGADTKATGAITLRVDTDIPSYDKWLSSGHSDRKAEAFRHWDDDGEIPANCARCHSRGGYQDYLGEDGSAVEKVDKAAALGTVVDCATCHNSAAAALDFVTFPSGEKLTGLGAEARCMTCHQGRASSDSVDSAVVRAAEKTTEVEAIRAAVEADTAFADERAKEIEIRKRTRDLIQDTVNLDQVPAPTTATDKLGFLNIHYYAAGATLNAGRVRGGYQYPGRVYDYRFRHVEEFDTCVECHDAHSLEVKVDECKTCHAEVSSAADLRKIRMIDSRATDFDGDDNVEEGIAEELAGLQAKLLAAIRAYAAEKNAEDGAICYAGASHPYFFKDSDANGECSSAEATSANAYTEWTPRLLRAAYNYQVAAKDPGAFAHNAKYIIQLVFDAITDLNAGITNAESRIDMSKADRDDPGHFNGAHEAARHWDEDEEVSASCSACHGGAEGLRFFLEFGVGKAVIEQANGLDCATCHENVGRARQEGESPWKLIEVNQVALPSGVTITKSGQDPDPALICGTCHKGRSAQSAVDRAIATAKANPDPTKQNSGFVNVHYKAAFSTWQGDKGKLGYQYPGKTYVGVSNWTGTAHAGPYDECIECHDPGNTKHSFAVADNRTDSGAWVCATCHVGATGPRDLTNPTRHRDDVDGDGKSPGGSGDTLESLAAEIDGLAAKLLLQMNAASPSNKKICYGTGHPYFFVDSDSNAQSLEGACDGPDTTAYRFDMRIPVDEQLLKAAHNYQIAHTEPGAWAHNFEYIWQLLYDSYVDLGGVTTGMATPPGR